MTALPPVGAADALYIVDLSGYVFRAYHAIAPLSSPSGEPSHATYGTITMLNRMIDERDPKLMAVAMDSKGPSFRKGIDDAYKANRPPPPEDLSVQMQRVRSLVELLGIQVWQQDGFEADDLIATAVRRALSEGLRVVIVSADKDLMQLVGGSVVMWDTMRNKVYGPAEVAEKFGVGPDKMHDLLALTGDSSDNVKGIPSVGPKTAAKLLEQFGSIEGIYEGIDQLKGKLRENLEANRAAADLARTLVALRDDLEIVFDKTALDFQPRVNVKGLEEAYTELGFTRMLDGLRKQMVIEFDRPKEAGYTAVLDEAALEAAARACREAGLFAFDTETDSTDPMLAHLVGISLACRPNEGWYVPVGHSYLGVPSQLSLERVRETLNPLFSSSDVRKVGHNLKYDETVVRRHGFDPLQGIASDTMVESYLLDPEASHGLKDLAKRELHVAMTTYDEVTGDKGSKGMTFDRVEVDRAANYACADADLSLQLHHVQLPRLEQQGLRELLERIEIPLSQVLVDVEMAGVLIDVAQLEQIGGMLRERMGELEARAKEQAGRDFNVGSPRQLETILFDELKLPVKKRTKSARSTDASVLEALSELHPLVGTILDLRQLSKLQSTYVEALPKLVHPQTGRIHTRFNQSVAATGRLSSSDPNLQNIPVRTEEGRAIRRAFIAPPGCVLISADYSQIELRVLAHLSKDPVLMNAFQRNEDVHTRTAMEIFDVPASEVAAEQRRQAKTINFGVIYGMGELALSKKLGIGRSEARAFIDRYFARYQGVRGFMESTLEAARQGQAVRTILGRQRHLPDLRSPNRGLRAQAERIAGNTPIQGSAADLLKLAMVRLAEPVVPGARMILTVHDELVFEVPEDRVDTAVPRIREAMESVMSLEVPLLVDVGVGSSWADAH
jgi:DNA polymerase-1